MCDQSINGSSIKIPIKITLEKALKLNSLDIFFEKVVLLGVIEFHGLQDDLKILLKRLRYGRHPVEKTKKTAEN